MKAWVLCGRLGLVIVGVCFVGLRTAGAQTVPPISGTPVIVSPEDLLDWPPDFPLETPNLSEPTSNRLADFHGEISACDIVLSTAGNYHMALRELWQLYLHTYVADLDIKNWFYTTSPPISVEQVQTGIVQLGNLNARCKPQVVVGNAQIMQGIVAAGAADGAAVPIIKNFGNVILVAKGNPHDIKTVWDLGKKRVTLVTPNLNESDSFGNFSQSIYDIAYNDPDPPRGRTAEGLFNSIFNTTNDGRKPKWVTGKRIMHREVPWAIASGQADAAVVFYHLALYFTETFPDRFEIVPLGGTIENPQPLPGNRVATLSAVRIKGDWNATQLEARERLLTALTSSDFTAILTAHGLLRP